MASTASSACPAKAISPCSTRSTTAANASQTIACRQEGGAAMMAEADGKLTGRPGICMVTRGPGATNASAGLHVAFQDSTPMILFIGQVGRDFLDREAFQEIDYRRMFGQLAKWVAQIDDAVAHSGISSAAPSRSRCPGGPARSCWRCRRTCSTEACGAPRCRAVAAGRDLSGARRRWRSCATMLAAARAAAPDPRRQRLGRRGLRTRAALRRGERSAGRRHVPPPGPLRQRASLLLPATIGVGVNPKLARARAGGRSADRARRAARRDDDRRLHAARHPGAAADDGPRPFRRRGARPRLSAGPCRSMPTPRGFAAMLATLEPVDAPRWAEWRESARADYEAWQKPRRDARASCRWREIVALAARDACRTTRSSPTAPAISPAGCTASIATAGSARSWRRPAARWATAFRRPSRPSSGTPSALVVCVAGDGDFLMTGQELATAVQYGAAVIVLVVDNGMYGTIRMHQERQFPGRVMATDLQQPGFRRAGARLRRLRRARRADRGFRRRRSSARVAAGMPALLHLKLDPEAITPSPVADADPPGGARAEVRRVGALGAASSTPIGGRP